MSYRLNILKDINGEYIKTEDNMSGCILYSCKLICSNTGRNFNFKALKSCIEEIIDEWEKNEDILFDVHINFNSLLGSNNCGEMLKQLYNSLRDSGDENLYHIAGLKNISKKIISKGKWTSVYYLDIYDKNNKNDFYCAILNFKNKYKFYDYAVKDYLNLCFDEIAENDIHDFDVISFTGNKEEDRFENSIESSKWKNHFKKKVLSWGQGKRKFLDIIGECWHTHAFIHAKIDYAKLTSDTLVIIDDIYTAGAAHSGVIEKIQLKKDYSYIYIIVLGHTSSNVSPGLGIKKIKNSETLVSNFIQVYKNNR